MAYKRHVVDIMKEYFKDIQRPNLFEVKMTEPSGVESILVHNMIQSVQIPSATLQTTEIVRMGQKVEIPGNVDYGDLSITFYVDVDGTVLEFFQKWKETYYDISLNLRKNPSVFIGGKLEIYQLDGMHDRKIVTTVNNVFPKSIGDIELGHESEDTLSTVSISFAFSYLHTKKVGAGV